MTTIEKDSQIQEKKSRSKTKWREIEALRDRYELMKELQENDYTYHWQGEELGA